MKTIAVMFAPALLLAAGCEGPIEPEQNTTTDYEAQFAPPPATIVDDGGTEGGAAALPTGDEAMTENTQTPIDTTRTTPAHAETR